jgi:lipid A 4'-phosphatase
MRVMTAAKRQAELNTRKVSKAVWFLASAIAVGVIAAIVFQQFPQIDLSTSGLFYMDFGNFFGMRSDIILALRSLLLALNVVIYIAALAGLIVALYIKGPWLGVAPSKWLFLVLCLAIGPGLTSNVVLKDNWGRARPSQIVDFGGTKQYTPPVTIADQCPRNCSFVAGEASTVYATFFAGAFIFPWLAGRMFAAGIIGGFLAGLVRMSQGAHFLSDVIFAGVAMAITVALIELVFEAVDRSGRQHQAR